MGNTDTMAITVRATKKDAKWYDYKLIASNGVIAYAEKILHEDGYEFWNLYSSNDNCEDSLQTLRECKQMFFSYVKDGLFCW